jgi:hypothetical protein
MIAYVRHVMFGRSGWAGHTYCRFMNSSFLPKRRIHSHDPFNELSFEVLWHLLLCRTSLVASSNRINQRREYKPVTASKANTSSAAPGMLRCVSSAF